ncbi:hypothetical protein EP7_005681 (plasmid) [Isosphaeraceae bacterium EP7]
MGSALDLGVGGDDPGAGVGAMLLDGGLLRGQSQAGLPLAVGRTR